LRSEGFFRCGHREVMTQKLPPAMSVLTPVYSVVSGSWCVKTTCFTMVCCVHFDYEFSGAVTPSYFGRIFCGRVLRVVNMESVIWPSASKVFDSQTRTDWEYIIVHNCSQDSPADLAGRNGAIDERIRVVRCDEFVNPCRNFSRSAQLMSPHSKYRKFLSADDREHPSVRSAWFRLPSGIRQLE
jgi:hypothetical protein